MIQQNYFSDLYSAKILDFSTKSFFPYTNIERRSCYRYPNTPKTLFRRHLFYLGRVMTIDSIISRIIKE